MLRWRLRAAANVVNLSTPFGIAVALLGRSRLRRGPRGLVLATDHRLPVIKAAAFTVGNVVLTPHSAVYLESRPALMRHEERHAWQYAVCLGLPLLPMYAVGSAWSFLRGGDVAVHNPFERLAGLAEGGYPALSVRERRRREGCARRTRRRRTGRAAP